MRKHGFNVLDALRKAIDNHAICPAGLTLPPISVSNHAESLDLDYDDAISHGLDNCPLQQLVMCFWISVDKTPDLAEFYQTNPHLNQANNNVQRQCLTKNGAKDYWMLLNREVWIPCPGPMLHTSYKRDLKIHERRRQPR